MRRLERGSRRERQVWGGDAGERSTPVLFNKAAGCDPAGGESEVADVLSDR